jgi:hypothetical protein
LAWLATTRDDNVRRIAVRAAELSPEAQREVVDRVNELRRAEHLDA